MRLGTRGSALAMWQARTVARLIEESGGAKVEIVVIRTSGDEGPPEQPVPRVSDSAAAGGYGPPSLMDRGELRRGLAGAASDAAAAEADATTPKLATDVRASEGGPQVPSVKRLFVKEIEEALLDGRIDLAVHSSKDLPAILPDGLMIGAALAREDPRDALLLPGEPGMHDLASMKHKLGDAPRIGTSSVRRMAELRALFPSATFIPIRGNVDTRVRKLDAGQCDALVLAAAGVKRLGLEGRISAFLPVEICVPAPGQGIVAVEIAERSTRAVRQAIATLADADATTALVAERAVVHALGGGCQMPLGALATVEGQQVEMLGVVASLDGRTFIRASASGIRGNAAAVGEKLARHLLDKGAAEILSSPHTK
jgi:hydroxymethylbilane synthase